MANNLPWIRRFQKQALQAVEKLIDKTSATLGDAKVGLQKLDDQFAITTKLQNTGNRIASAARQADQNHAISVR